MISSQLASLQYNDLNRQANNNSMQLQLCKTSENKAKLGEMIAKREADQVVLEKALKDAWALLMKTKGF